MFAKSCLNSTVKRKMPNSESSDVTPYISLGDEPRQALLWGEQPLLSTGAQGGRIISFLPYQKESAGCRAAQLPFNPLYRARGISPLILPTRCVPLGSSRWEAGQTAAQPGAIPRSPPPGQRAAWEFRVGSEVPLCGWWS